MSSLQFVFHEIKKDLIVFPCDNFLLAVVFVSFHLTLILCSLFNVCCFESMVRF